MTLDKRIYEYILYKITKFTKISISLTSNHSVLPYPALRLPWRSPSQGHKIHQHLASRQQGHTLTWWPWGVAGLLEGYIHIPAWWLVVTLPEKLREESSNQTQKCQGNIGKTFQDTGHQEEPQIQMTFWKRPQPGAPFHKPGWVLGVWQLRVF